LAKVIRDASATWQLISLTSLLRVDWKMIDVIFSNTLLWFRVVASGFPSLSSSF